MSGRQSSDYTLRGSWGWRLVDGLTVGPNDWEIEKFRPDVFVGDLDRRAFTRQWN